MDFSQDVIIEFALNLGGYLIVLMLLLLLMKGKTAPKKEQLDHVVDDNASIEIPEKSVQPAAPSRKVDPEFIAFQEDNRTKKFDNNILPVKEAEPVRHFTQEEKRKNRREIYKEARRLLAKGHSGGDVMRSLPLTEDEVDILSIAGKA